MYGAINLVRNSRPRLTEMFSPIFTVLQETDIALRGHMHGMLLISSQGCFSPHTLHGCNYITIGMQAHGTLTPGSFTLLAELEKLLGTVCAQC